MKIMVYNIAYATGLKGSLREYILKFWRYLWVRGSTLRKISDFLQKQKADVICLLEIDAGSIRNRFRSQIKMLADKMLYPFYYSKPKYHPSSVAKIIPTIRKHHDAIFSKHDGLFNAHYFSGGTKKLIQEFIVDGISIFAVHLSVLRKRLRKAQLKDLTKILKACPREHIVCGDFNIFRGLGEVQEFIDDNNLNLVIQQATFPTYRPKKQIDLILVSKALTIKNAGVENVPYSDHLPVWVEI